MTKQHTPPKHASGTPVERPVGRLAPERTDCLPQITHVAIQYAGRVWALPAPNRHHDVIRHIAEQTGDGIRGPDVQGFLDSNGRFLRRAQAYTIARWSGQLQRKPGGYQGTDLYSEDLW